MSWNPHRNRKQNDHNQAWSSNDNSVASDDDVKIRIARPTTVESSDDDDSYYDRSWARRGRRSHLASQEGTFHDDRSNPNVPLPASRSSKVPSANDEKEIYRQASELVDQHVSSHTNRTIMSTATTANTINTSTSTDEKEIYRQASDMIDSFASSRNLTANGAVTEAEDTSWGVSRREPVPNNASTPLMSTITPTEHAVARAVVSSTVRRPGAFAIPGPGSAHTLGELAVDAEESSVAHGQSEDTDDMLHEKGTSARLPNLAPATPTNSARRQRSAPVPGAQYVRGVAPGVRITNYLEQLRREATQQFVVHEPPPIPESTMEPVERIEPVEETYPVVAEEDKKVSRRKLYLLIAMVACVAIGAAVGIAIAVSGSGGGGGKSANSGNTSTSNKGGNNLPPTPVPSTTQFSPYTSDCQALRSQVNPNVLSQCFCSGKIKTVPKDVAALYDALSQSFASTVFSDFHETIASCSARNQALVWLSSGDGGVSTSNDVGFMKQRYCLAVLFILWNGVQWKTNRDWMSATSECNWYGIGCNDQYEVISVALPDLNLVGALSFEMALLTKLQSMDLSNNDITGSIDTRLGVLTELQSFNLDNNNLNGTLPSELALMTSLQSFQMASNHIQGSIPTDFGSFHNLSTIDFSNNTLTGELPTGLGMLVAAEMISLEFNRFNRTIPTELGMIVNLLNLNLRGNGLHGSIPSEVANLKNLQFLDLEENAISGTIPSQIGHLSQLQSLKIDSNNITGTIPSELGLCTGLVLLDVADNKLHGTLPPELGHLSAISLLNVDGNKLTGQVPEPVCSLLTPISCIPTLVCSCSCHCYRNKN